MVKKRVRDPEVLVDAPSAQAEDEDSGSDVDMINVEFEVFDYKEIDFHGLKSLLRQLFDVDSQLFDLSALADLIISQKSSEIGSTAKVDGEETDPYAFLTILNLHEHKEKKVIQDLTQYIAEKSKTNPALSDLETLLSAPSSQVGLILADRFINAPSELSPPMYRRLIDEIETAVDDYKEPYAFTHYLMLSKTYNEIESTLDQEDAPKTKKSKAAKKVGRETFYFHPEDEAFQRHALASGGYEYSKDEGEGQADSRRAFQDAGIRPQGSLILIEASKFEDAVKAAEEYLPFS